MLNKNLISNSKHIARTKNFRINRQIESPEVAIINEENGQLEIMKLENALSLAHEKEFDLVEVSPNVTPPVCKIMDYGKHLYKLTKQKRQHSAKQKRVEVKGIRLSVRTEKHDLEFKARNVVKFMKKGNRVKIDMILKGREKANKDFAGEKLNNFLQIISDLSKASPETAETEIITEKDQKKKSQGLSVVMEYKKS